MDKIFFTARVWLRWPVLAGAMVAAGLSWFAVGAGTATPPDIKKVALSSEPLYVSGRGDKPTMTLAFSVDYATAGAKYRDPASPASGSDRSYSNATEYLGYWDADSCYVYSNANSADTASDPKRFIRSGPAHTVPPAQRTCVDAFSGNFLNWACASAIDVLRIALTGGDRVLDTETKTVLQRAVLPDGSFNPLVNFSAGNAFFPRKYLSRGGGSSGKPYFGAVPQSMVTYADNADAIVIKNTRNEIRFARSLTPDDHSFTSTQYGQPFLYSRVEVCAKDGSGNLQEKRPWTFCTQQPSGNYKPTGVLQKYSDHMRVAVFGYLMDGDGRYGGVLRAPMKFTSHRTFDVTGAENTPRSGNPDAEWDLTTGVFQENPLGDSVFGVSGVVNYINRFGRNGQYKDRDPMGELHLEALRYLQGRLLPTPAAVGGLDGKSSNGLYGSFPAYTAWADPYEGRPPDADYTCHRANLLAVGDAATWDHRTFPAADTATDMPDMDFWSRVVQRFEAGSGGTYADGEGKLRNIWRTGDANSVFPGPDGANKFQIYGSAYWARSHDIRDLAWTSAQASRRPKNWRGLRVRTLIFDLNREGLSDANYNNNPLFMAAKYGGYATDSLNANGGPYNTWGNPFFQSGDASDADLGSTSGLGPRGDYIWASRDVGREGVADTYYRAGTSALSTIAALDGMFSRSVASASSVAQGAGQFTNLTQAGNFIYRASLDASDWRGDLAAYPVAVNSSNATSIGDRPIWSAAAQLNAMSDPAKDRKIFTGSSGSGANPVAVDFKWDAISATLKTALNQAAFGAAEDGLGEQRLNYIRGESSNDGTFRRRYQLMGDVINSGVVYSGAPSTGVSSASTYTTFYSANKNRTPMVAVGANDGMLHAFDANDGKELFAYIPSWVATNLSALTHPTYVDNHRSYVDGTPAVGEAELSSGWATVLVSGTGAGGKGVFALDVTDPANFSASKVLWEFTNADDPDFDLGNVVGKPQILKMRTNPASAPTATYKWFAVFGNGVNSYVADANGRFSTTGKPALYFLDLSKPAGESWVAGTNYYKVSFPTKTALNPSTAAGIVNFTAVRDSRNTVRNIYAGDLQGNLWKLNFAQYGAAGWNLANLSAFKSGAQGGGTPIPMYIAKDATGQIQPISDAPTISAGEATGTRYVMFGTGKYLESADKLSQAVQSAYSLFDDGSIETDGVGVDSAITSRAFLQPGAADAGTGIVTVASYTPARAKTTNTALKSGWYFDFPTPGERQVNGGSVLGSEWMFSTLIPVANPSTAYCRTTTAGGTQYLVKVVTGGGVASASTVGIPGELLLLDMPGSTLVSAVDSTGRKTKTILTRVIQQGSGGLTRSTLGGSANDKNCPPDTPAGVICTRVVAGRLSWRQVNNYHALKEATDW